MHSESEKHVCGYHGDNNELLPGTEIKTKMSPKLMLGLIEESSMCFEISGSSCT